MADEFRPLRLGTIMTFGSLEFMSHGSGYDMILLPPRDNAEPHPKPISHSQCVGGARDTMQGEPSVGVRGPGSLTPLPKPGLI